MCNSLFDLDGMEWNSGSPMLGDRDRVRDAVGWELGDSTLPPLKNTNGGQQKSSWGCGIGSGGDDDIGEGSTAIGGPPRPTQFSYADDYDEDTTNNNYGEASGECTSMGAGTSGKEVRYAPLPLVQSPTHSITNTQGPLQRSQSRYGLETRKTKISAFN